MNVLLLAAGRGERLKPYTNDSSKMHDSNKRYSLIENLVEKFMEKQAIGKIFINTHYLPEIVHEFVSKNYCQNNEIELIREELVGHWWEL